MSGQRDDLTAAERLEAERDRVEISPAQPDAHVKHDDAGRMQH